MAVLDDDLLAVEPRRPRHVLEPIGVRECAEDRHALLGEEVVRDGYVVRRGEMRDLDELADAADAAEVRHPDVRGAMRQHLAEAVARRLGLAARERRVERRCNAGRPAMIVGWHGLLEPRQVERFELAAEADRVIGGEAAARVAHQRHLRPDRLAHRRDALDVLLDVLLADAHLDAAEPLRDVTRRFRREFIRRRRQPQAGARIHGYPLVRGPEHVRHRLPERLALGVP